jgi:hypothetical protein
MSAHWFERFWRISAPGIARRHRKRAGWAAVLVELPLFGLAAIIVASVISVIAPG